MVRNAYIHIPFCRHKCHYCSFLSFAQPELKEQYLDALQKEIQYFYKKETLNTLYFGGGTPSLLNASEFEKIIGRFDTLPQTEISAELNPENITYCYLKDLKQAGINRLSFGCQTFDDDKLQLIGRHHTSGDVVNAVNYAFDCGFDNISLDFIYGLPGQTVKDFENDLLKAVSLKVQHISLYGLKIDKKCYFYTHPPDNLGDEDLQADMYLSAIKILTDNGFEHYEISNFSKKGFQSKHNLNYWDNNTYYGFGVGAHGYVDSVRYQNVDNFKQYFKNPAIHHKKHLVSFHEKLEEEIFLGFRKRSGIAVNEINNKFHINFEKEYKTVINKYINSGHIEKIGLRYRLTTNGILVSNVILADFLG